MVRGYLPDADIRFENETGGKDESAFFLMDNSCLIGAYDVQLSPWPERVLQIINAVRVEEGLEPISG